MYICNMTLKNTISDKGFSGNKFAKELKTMGVSTFWKYIDDPKRYTVIQLEEMASILGIDHTELLTDLELI